VVGANDWLRCYRDAQDQRHGLHWDTTRHQVRAALRDPNRPFIRMMMDPINRLFYFSLGLIT
jgi:hypothetical protein